uniref:ArnT family glycosyltransferase n=1 Tax=Ningiella ruwaisensis TaxID=2364274 RepID=UPI00109F5CF9|nr:glycosyltransferase family 39 protein [Ningiella ruwaisensis]
MAMIQQRLLLSITASSLPLFMVASLLIFSGIGLRDPWPADEPRFALIAKDMVETGQWFFPSRAGELYPDKPPLFMWAIAIFYWLTSNLRIAFLLPSAIAALITIALTYDIAKRMWNKKVGLIAGWMLLFSFQFLLQAKTAQIDAVVCAFMTFACYGLLRFLVLKDTYRWYASAWFFMGLGVITKGVGFLPLLMLIPYIWYGHKAPKSNQCFQISAIKWATGPLFMLAAISIWLIPMLVLVSLSDSIAHEAYRDNILLKQTVTRYADSWHHLKPFWYYITSVAPWFWLPTSFAAIFVYKDWQLHLKKHELRVLLPLGYVVLMLLFFSLSPGKRGVYILPALPMFVLAVAPFYARFNSHSAFRYGLLVLSLIVAVSLSILGLLGAMGVPSVSSLTGQLAIQPWTFLALTGITALLFVLLSARINILLAWPLVMSVIWLSYSTYGYILRNPYSVPVGVLNQIKQHVSAEPELAMIDMSEQFFLFSPYTMTHFGYHTPNDIQLKSAYQWLESSNQYILIEKKLADDTCFDTSEGHDLGFAHRRHWLLLPATSKRPDLNSLCGLQGSSVKIFSRSVLPKL